MITGDDIPTNPRLFDKLVRIVDELGYASAAAQGLHGPITSLAKLRSNSNQRLYIMRDGQNIRPRIREEDSFCEDLHMFHSGGLSGFKDETRSEQFSIVGMLKVGVKRLFVEDELDRQIEIAPLCILDFYIDEKLQRRGFGRRLFHYMLQMEVATPRLLAYDRPSMKFLSFLKKYHNLEVFVQQRNSFVIFREYGLSFLDLDSRGRPKTSLPKRVERTPTADMPEAKKKKDIAPVHQQTGSRAQIFQHMTKRQAPKTAQYQAALLPPISSNPGVTTKDNHLLADIPHSITPTLSAMIEQQHPVIQDEIPRVSTNCSMQKASKSSLSLNHDTIIRQQSQTSSISADSEDDPISKYLPKNTMQRTLDQDSILIEPSIQDIIWKNNNERINQNNEWLPTTIVAKMEVERQNRVNELTESQKKRLPPIMITHSPIRKIYHSAAAGLKSGIEPRKRNYQMHHYKTLQGHLNF